MIRIFVRFTLSDVDLRLTKLALPTPYSSLNSPTLSSTPGYVIDLSWSRASARLELGSLRVRAPILSKNFQLHRPNVVT